MRKLWATILLVAMLISIFPQVSVLAAESKDGEMTLSYEVDFRGTKDIFEPDGVSGAFANFTYTPSADGRAITIKGVDYEGKDPNGQQVQAYWGGIVKGLTANAKSVYELTYKVRNDSTKPYSQVGIGGLIPETGVATSFWNVASTYNASGNVVLGMMSGNRSSIGGSTANKNTLQREADRDAEGFLEIKLRFSGPREAMTLYTKVGGEWQELYEREVAIQSGCRMAVMLYSLRSGAINMTIKDMKFYSNQGKVASTVEKDDEIDESMITGYYEEPKIITLAEVKPRYGIQNKLSATGGVAGVATFRDRMDAYLAYCPYQANMGVSLRETFLADSAKYKSLYVTFRCAIDPDEDTKINESPESVKLMVTSDGKNWTDSGATFTVEATGEKTVAAQKVATDAEGNYLFDDEAMIPVYEFTSSTFAPNNIKNIRLIPTTGAGKGNFRLVSLYVWADTGEIISVPILDGNLNTSVATSKKGSKTLYDLYSTDFSDTNGWTSNFVNFRERTSETVNGETHPYCYFTASGVLPTMDGMQARVYSPDMALDLKPYDKVKVEFKCFRIDSEGDPDLKDMLLGYSTDHGETWVQLKAKPKLERSPAAESVDGAGYSTYSVSVDLKEYVPNGTIITNVVILPYGNKVWYTIDLIGGNLDLLRRVDGPMVGSKGAFRMLEFSITGYSAESDVEAEPIPVYQNHYDSTVIQTMINAAKAAGKKEVTIPPINPRTGTNVWTITRTIKVPSNMTLYINNCILRMGNYARCRMMQNEHCPSKSVSQTDRNIHILGVGNAILQGGVFNGMRTETINGSTLSTWDNMTIALQNVEDYSLENLRIEESRYWSIAMYYCRNGIVQHIDLFNNRKLYVDGVEMWEQDGVDVRPGCHHVQVNDITGRSGDDSVALNAIRPGDFIVPDLDPDIHDIKVTNIATKQERMRMNLRITACNGFHIYNVLADGFYDTMADFGGKVSRNTVQIGNSAKAYIIEGGHAMEVGDIHDIYIRNITGCTPYPIATFHSNVHPEHWAYEYDTCRNLYSGKSFSSLICYGDQLSNNLLVPQSCNHEFTRKLTGTNHLNGLPAEAANFDWYACTKCNAVKRPDGVTELLAQLSGANDSAEETAPVITFTRFTDVASDSPFKDAIEWAADRKITLGKTATTFEPNTTCTIANIITFIWRANGSPEPALLNSPFADIEPDAYYYNAALWAYENGMVGGTKFRPNEPCTRAMTVSYLWIQAKRPKPASTDLPFTDLSETADYRKAVAWALEKGITTGVTETTFVPDATCTRGQIATFLYRAINANG